MSGAEGIPTGNTYDKYTSQNALEGGMLEGFFRSLDAILDRVEPSMVLEVGAGEGEVVAKLRSRYPEVPVVALDLPDDDLARHWQEGGVVGVQGSVEDLPFPDDCADLVLGIEMLEHVPRPDRALEEIRRVASGDVVLSVPREPIWRIGNMARGRYWRDLGNTPGHIQHWSKSGFAKLVGRYFDVQEVSSPLPWTMVHARVG